MEIFPRLLQWNCRSLVKNKSNLTYLLHSQSITLAALSETWLLDSMNVSVSGFVCHRHDRADGWEGAALLIKNGIPHSRIPIPFPDDDVQMENCEAHWQVKCKTAVERNAQVLDLELWTDCCFEVESQAQLFKGHKLILAMASPVFAAMFFGEMAEKKEPIKVNDVEPEIFKAFLQYVYTEHIDFDTMDAAIQVYSIADRYILPELMRESMQYISTNLSASNACGVYEFAKLYNELELKDLCLQLMKWQTEIVLSHDDFYCANIDTLVEICDMPLLNISNEIVLFKAVEKYSSNQNNNKIQPGSLESTQVHDALKKIRFLTLSPEQFAKEVSKTSLLSQSEMFSILLNITSTECDTPMPEGFSMLKDSRRCESLDNTKHCFIRVIDEKMLLDAAFRIIRSIDYVFFCNTSEKMEKVRSLKQDYHPLLSIDIDMTQADIDSILQKHYDSTCDVVAHDSTAKRIDMEKVYCVINYDLPSDSDYINRVPRRHYRQFNPIIINLVTDEQLPRVMDIEDRYLIKMKELPVNDDLRTAIHKYSKT